MRHRRAGSRGDQEVAAAGDGTIWSHIPEGGVLRNQDFRRRHFDPAGASVGLHGLVPHELRHTAASLAIAAGSSIKGVQAVLGHGSATLTLDRYGHLLPDQLDAIAERLDAAARARGAPFLRPVTRIERRRVAATSL